MEFTSWVLRELQIPAFSPIVYGHEMAKKHALPTDAGWWARFNMEMLRKCDGCYVLHLPGWDTSVGVKLELNVCRILRIPVFHYQFNAATKDFEMVLDGKDNSDSGLNTANSPNGQ